MKKVKRILLIILLIVAVISILDIISMNSGIFGTPANYLVGNFGVDWWSLFYKIGLAMIILVSLIYFILKKDFSESLSIFLGSMVLWFTGFPDLLFFIFQGKLPPSSLSWLNGSYVGKISHLFGIANVNKLSFIISITIGLIIAYIIVKFLEKQKW